MKALILCIVAISISTIAFGQSAESSKIGLYKWSEVTLMQPCDIEGKDLTTVISSTVTASVAEIPSKVGQKFRVIKIINGADAIIQILDYTIPSSGGNKKYTVTEDFFVYNFNGLQSDYDNLAAAKANARYYGTHQKYFKVGVTIVEELAVKQNRIGGSIAAGVINFPFKYRPQKNNADFSGAFNFGAGIGYTLPHQSSRQFTHSLLSGYSISNIVLDSANTSKNQGTLSSTNNFSAFSFSLGYLIQYNKVQAGIFIGWDRIAKINQRQFDWQYQGKPWLSVGFGIAIFSVEKEKENKNSDAHQSSE